MIIADVFMKHHSSSVLYSVLNLVMHLKYVREYLLSMQDGHTYIPPPGRTLYLEVGMCVCVLCRGGGLLCA